MRNKCVIKDCAMPNISIKVNEDFEALIYGICWQCGDKLKEIIGWELMNDFQHIISLIEENIE